jgi:SAM-dependent methyltransferase
MAVTYEPDLYDVTIPGSFLGDIEWYRQKARDCGSPILELGAGTGRITLPIAEDGGLIYALDADPGMLSSLQRKRARLPPEVQQRIVVIEGDMRDFHLDERFALIMSPFRAFLHNVTEQDQLACLRCVREHLRPGGRFAFNVFHPSLEFMAQHAGALAGVWRWHETCPLQDGGHVVRSDANRYDTVRQHVHSLHRYEEYGPDGILRRTFLHRLEVAYLYPPQIQHLLERTGFREIQIAGGFDGRPFASDIDELVVEAARD